MKTRHSQFDVSNTVKVTDSQAVCNAVCDIFHGCYLLADDSFIRQAFEDFDNLFEGHYHGFNACDTFYHDKQHTLDMTLALTRLIDGHERQSNRVHTFGAKLTSVTIITSQEFEKTLMQNPAIALNLIKGLNKTLRLLTDNVRGLALMDVYGRVARTLLDMCKQPDAMSHPDGTQIHISRQEIGRIVGCSREMAGRVLKAMEEEKMVSAAGMEIVIFHER